MLQLLALFLSKIVDVLLKRADLKKDERGPLRLFELYLSLRQVIRGAKIIEKEVRESIESDRHIPHIAMEIEAQARNLDTFRRAVADLVHLEVFERELYESLTAIVGHKFHALSSYYGLFEKIDAEHLLVSDWHGLLPERDVWNAADVEEAVRSGVATATRYDLRNADDLRRLLAQAERNIALMEATLARLGDFMKANFSINDLFPKSPLGW